MISNGRVRVTDEVMTHQLAETLQVLLERITVKCALTGHLRASAGMELCVYRTLRLYECSVAWQLARAQGSILLQIEMCHCTRCVCVGRCTQCTSTVHALKL